MFKSIRRIILATALAISGFAVVGVSSASAQGYTPGGVVPCPGGTNGWVAVYQGAANCTKRNWYYSGTSNVAYTHYVVDLHNANSSGATCDYNVNCLRGALECFTLPNTVRDAYVGAAPQNPAANALNWGTNQPYYASIFSGVQHAWWSQWGVTREAYPRGSGVNPAYAAFSYIDIPNITGVSGFHFGAKATTLEGWPTYISQTGLSNIDCFFYNRGQVAGRLFQAAMSATGDVEIPGYTQPSDILSLFFWVHCNIC